jgi:hypothetical protein
MNSILIKKDAFFDTRGGGGGSVFINFPAISFFFILAFL